MKQNEATKVDVVPTTTYGTFFSMSGIPVAKKETSIFPLTVMISDLPNSLNGISTQRIPSPPKRQKAMRK